MKRIFSLALILILTAPLLFGCTGGDQTYTDELSCAELMDTLEKQVPVDFGYETFGPDQIQFYFENTDAHDDACLRYSKQSENINEIGVFHTPDQASAREIRELIDRYLTQLAEDQGAFIGSYAPEELPKLEQAEYRTYGNYTVYAILDEKDRTLVFQTAEKILLRESES